MGGIPFHATPMGRTFYEQTMPELVRQVTRLNDLLDHLADRLGDDTNSVEDEPDP